MKNEMPIYNATKSLDVGYNFNYCNVENASVEVKSKYIHAILKTGHDQLFEIRKNMGYKTHENPDHINIATCALTFLYTDTNSDEGYLGEDVKQKSCFITIPSKADHRIYSIQDFYKLTNTQQGVIKKKSLGCYDFKAFLLQRVKAFSEIKHRYYYAADTVCDQKMLEKKIEDKMFDRTFHHSEQGIMHYLNSKEGIKYVTQAARECKASYMYGVVLDIYTYRLLCNNCNVSLLGMQNSQNQGFLLTLSTALEKKNIQPRVEQNLMLHTRVSASIVCKSKKATMEDFELADDKGCVHCYDADTDNQVFQAKSKSLGINKIEKSIKQKSKNPYRGAFFTSRTLDKKNLEKNESFRLEAKPRIEFIPTQHEP